MEEDDRITCPMCRRYKARRCSIDNTRPVPGLLRRCVGYDPIKGGDNGKVLWKPPYDRLQTARKTK